MDVLSGLYVIVDVGGCGIKMNGVLTLVVKHLHMEWSIVSFTSFCYLHGVHLDWMQFGFGFNSELFAQLPKFLISNACLKNLQVIWKMDCLTWRWANLLRLGLIWVRFYSIFQLWQSTKLIPPTIQLIFYNPIWIRMEAR
jgi:hypothetical protein